MAANARDTDTLETWYNALQLDASAQRQQSFLALTRVWLVRDSRSNTIPIQGPTGQSIDSKVQSFLARFGSRLWPAEEQDRRHLSPQATIVYSFDMDYSHNDSEGNPPLVQAVRMYFDQVNRLSWSVGFTDEADSERLFSNVVAP